MQKQVLRVLGLSLLATLGLMAFAFALASAQADEIRVLGAKAKTGQPITGKQEGAGELLVPALNIKIRCPDFGVLQAFVDGEGAGLAEILFLGCKVFTISTGVEISNCRIFDGVGMEKEGYITAKAILSVDLVAASIKTLVVAKPDSQTFLAKFKFAPLLGCPLATPFEIRGQAGFSVVTGNLQAGSEVKELLVQSYEAIQKFHGELRYGALPAYIDGSAKFELATVNVGCTWGAI